MNYNVLDFGAIPDGKTLCTVEIQKAIDTCSQNGGGTLFFPNGTYLTGSIHLKSNVIIELEISAVILGSPNREDYPRDTYKIMYKKEAHMDACLIFAENCENIGFKGYGMLDGNGATHDKDRRAMLCRFLNCKNIKIENIKMYSPGSWTNAFLGCEKIFVRGIDIVSRANNNGDGLDFDGCNNVMVSDCSFDCSDDCICLQNSYTDRVCSDIVVTNCTFCSKWAGMRIGLLSVGDIENLTVSNCVFKNIDCSGLKIQSAEGAALRNMTFTNLVMKNVLRPIFMTLNQYRERVGLEDVAIEKMSVLENMIFTNIIANNTDEEHFADVPEQPQCFIFDSIDGGTIKNITLENVIYNLAGKDDFTREGEIPQHIGVRAEGRNYEGDLPCYGVFARNVENLKLKDINIKTTKNDKREKLHLINTTI